MIGTAVPTSPLLINKRENRSDREITKQIRQALVQDGSLSSYAHNVKIVTQGGMVTLKGPVRSDEEKKAVEAKAG
jgi:hyperosmotically inducible protein